MTEAKAAPTGAVAIRMGGGSLQVVAVANARAVLADVEMGLPPAAFAYQETDTVAVRDATDVMFAKYAYDVYSVPATTATRAVVVAVTDPAAVAVRRSDAVPE
ncbi:hypothetical protein [Streptomyces niveus]|uniref:hypothetical protein n=1 Tax=Streptomyces niveus TaxID=193462 RepID=UPI003865E4F9